MKVYLDNCCYNRPFDDQGGILIRIETEAKLFVQYEIHAGRIELANLWNTGAQPRFLPGGLPK